MSPQGWAAGLSLFTATRFLWYYVPLFRISGFSILCYSRRIWLTNLSITSQGTIKHSTNSLVFNFLLSFTTSSPSYHGSFYCIPHLEGIFRPRPNFRFPEQKHRCCSQGLDEPNLVSCIPFFGRHVIFGLLCFGL